LNRTTTTSTSYFQPFQTCLRRQITRMKLLLIGGTGNISAECAALLHQRRHEVLILTRGRSAVPAQYHAIQADRKNLAAMRAALKGHEPDVVINFIGFEPADVDLDYELFRDAVRQYIFISSTTVYARPPASLPFTEDAALGNPWWDYAQKKVLCEQSLRQRHQENGFPLTIVRPSHTYSKRWIPNPVGSSSYTFAARLEQGKPVFVPDDGENPWTLTSATDFAVGLVGLIGNPKAIGEAFHITSDEVLTWNQIYSEIAAALGVSSPEILKIPTEFICQAMPSMIGPLKGDKAHPGVFDTSKIKRFVPEFRCVKPFRFGIRESVAWLREHPEQQNLNPQFDETIERVITAWRKAERSA
jgi:nucleoside-diphosphate-sugar epimerase